MKLPRYPIPPRDAGYLRRLLQLFVIPTALGAALGVGVATLAGAPGIVAVCVLVLVWTERQRRWTKRQQADIRAERERLQELLRG